MQAFETQGNLQEVKNALAAFCTELDKSETAQQTTKKVCRISYQLLIDHCYNDQNLRCGASEEVKPKLEKGLELLEHKKNLFTNEGCESDQTGPKTLLSYLIAKNVFKFLKILKANPGTLYGLRIDNIQVRD